MLFNFGIRDTGFLAEGLKSSALPAVPHSGTEFICSAPPPLKRAGYYEPSCFAGLEFGSANHLTMDKNFECANSLREFQLPRHEQAEGAFTVFADPFLLVRAQRGPRQDFVRGNRPAWLYISSSTVRIGRAAGGP